MMKLLMEFYDHSIEALEHGCDVDDLLSLSVREQIGRFKYYNGDDIQSEYSKISQRLNTEISEVISKEAE